MTDNLNDKNLKAPLPTSTGKPEVTLGFAVRDPEGSIDVEAVQDEHALKDPLRVDY